MEKINVKLNEKCSVEFDVVCKNEKGEVIETIIPFEKLISHVDVMDNSGNLITRINNEYVDEVDLGEGEKMILWPDNKKYDLYEYDNDKNIINQWSANNLNNLSEECGIPRNKLNRLLLGYYRNKKSESVAFTKRYELICNRDIHKDYERRKNKLKTFRVKIYKDNEEPIIYKNKLDVVKFLNSSKYKVNKAIKNKTKINEYNIEKIKEYK